MARGKGEGGLYQRARDGYWGAVVELPADPMTGARVDLEGVQSSDEQVEASRRGAQDLIDLFAPAVRHVIDFINKRDLPGVAKVPPKDPRERALWLCDNRNTGPAKPHNGGTR